MSTAALKVFGIKLAKKLAKPFGLLFLKYLQKKAASTKNELDDGALAIIIDFVEQEF